MKLINFFSSQIKNSPWRAMLYGLGLMVVTVVFIVLIGNILDHVPFIVSFDKSIYEWINLGPHPAWLDTIVAPFNFNFLPWGGTFIPSFLYFVFALGLIYILIFNRKNLLFAFLAVILAIAVDAVLFKLTNTYVVRDRPFVHLMNSLSDSSKAIWVNWPTYPSGHVRDMALYSTVLSGYAPKLFWPFVIITVWVSYTRIYLGAHYPTDVIAGLILGYLVGLGILIIVKSFQQIVGGKKNPAEITATK